MLKSLCIAALFLSFISGSYADTKNIIQEARHYLDEASFSTNDEFLSNIRKSLQLCKSGLETIPSIQISDRVNLYFIQGNAYELMGDFKAARASYTDAITLEPENHEILYRRSMVYAAAGDIMNALADINIVLMLNPFHTYAHGDKGFLLFEQKKYPAAILSLSKHLDINNIDSEALKKRGLAYARLEKNNLAMNDFITALKITEINHENIFGSNWRNYESPEINELNILINRVGSGND